MNNKIANINFPRNRDTLFLLGLLGMVVIIPTIGLLWFMSNAIDSEHLTVERRLVEFYSSQISSVQPAVNKFWTDKRLQLSSFDSDLKPSELFLSLIHRQCVDSAVIFGPDGRLMYPFLVVSPISAPGISETVQNISNEWEIAHKSEFVQKDLSAAIIKYDDIAKQAKSSDETAEALQSKIRCLLKLNRQSEAVEIIDSELNKKQYFSAKDYYGRLIVPNVQLMALNIIHSPASKFYQKIKSLLIQRITNYNQYYFPTSQRLFLMRSLLKLDSHLNFPTLPAETYLNELLSINKLFFKNATLINVSSGKVFLLTSEDGRVNGIYSYERIVQEIQPLINSIISLPDIKAKIALKSTKEGTSFFQSDLGQEMPDWELRLYHEDENPFSRSTAHRKTVYVWITILIVGALAFLSMIITSLLLKQNKLTQLKNDFLATVSHELKTPLTSTRVFVDTLLDGQIQDEKKTKNYLKLIAKENQRLNHLIDNFLSFSRMELNKYTFTLHETDPIEILIEAVENVKECFKMNNCTISTDIDKMIPLIVADKNAMITVILNLLDNAYKYSKSERQIIVRLTSQNSYVCFQVQDNGIGLSPRHFKNVFKRFYQIDTRLSRQVGGCGLGLSIVKYIVEAHKGKIEIKSELGKGSKFTVKIPITKNNK